jgi:hypothetical protein
MVGWVAVEADDETGALAALAERRRIGSVKPDLWREAPTDWRDIRPRPAGPDDELSPIENAAFERALAEIGFLSQHEVVVVRVLGPEASLSPGLIEVSRVYPWREGSIALVVTRKEET